MYILGGLVNDRTENDPFQLFPPRLKSLIKYLDRIRNCYRHFYNHPINMQRIYLNVFRRFEARELNLTLDSRQRIAKFRDPFYSLSA